MSDDALTLPEITQLGRDELEDAFTKTFDDDWIAGAKQAVGPEKTLSFMRQVQTAVTKMRTIEFETIAGKMQGNEKELRTALANIKTAKKDVGNIVGYIQAATKVLALFEKALALVSKIP